ncbi:LysR family transcriptional regulator [Microbacterium lacus]|uniref:LysR family transcriptional regulator n=1 Tax=Microbacterium lacus TaxID=415217 RepID=UPI00384AD21A
MLNPVHLRTLAVVVRTGSFANAARQIGYTGSAVSQQVAALEQSLQLELFERDAHSIRPTPTATFLAERAHDILAALGALEDDVRGLNSGTLGQLRVGGFATANELLVPRSLAGYLRTHPRMDISVDDGEPEDLIMKLSDAALDIAVVYEFHLVPQRWPARVTVTHLLDEDLHLLVPRSHPLLHANAVDIEDLSDETWVSTKEGTAADTCLARLCAAAGFDPLIAMRGAHCDSVRGLVHAGLGIALVPAMSVLPTDHVVPLTTPNRTALRRVVALHHAGQQNSRASDAVSSLKRVANKLAEELPGVSTAARPPRPLTAVEDLASLMAVAS